MTHLLICADGYAEMTFTNVLVPCENRLLDEGQAFRMAQGSFSTARFYLCCNLIGTAERALSFMKARVWFGLMQRQNVLILIPL